MSDVTRVPSAVSTPEQVRAAVAIDGAGPHGFGKLVDGGPAGPDSQWRKVVGTASATYNIPHSLGFIPALALLRASHNTGGTPSLNAVPFEYDKWTATEVRVRVDVVGGVGGLAGTAMWFQIGGQR